MARRDRLQLKAVPQLDLFAFAELTGANDLGVRQIDDCAVSKKPAPASTSRPEPAVRKLAATSTTPAKPKTQATTTSRGPSTDASPAEPRSTHLLDVRAAAAWLGLSKSTLDKMRHYGTGPRYIRATCRAVRYDPDDLRVYAESRGHSPVEG